MHHHHYEIYQISNKSRRKTVSGAEEAIISDRNVSPRLGFLSNSMKIKRRKARKRMCDSAEWLYPISKTEGLEAGENNKMMTRTKYTLEAVLFHSLSRLIHTVANRSLFPCLFLLVYSF